MGGESLWDWPGPEVEQGAELSWGWSVVGEVVVPRGSEEAGAQGMFKPAP